MLHRKWLLSLDYYIFCVEHTTLSLREPVERSVAELKSSLLDSFIFCLRQKSVRCRWEALLTLESSFETWAHLF